MQRTLLILSLVSRLLYRIASPTVWEVVDIRKLSPARTISARSGSRIRPAHSRLLDYLISQPQISQHIRVLSIIFSDEISFSTVRESQDEFLNRMSRNLVRLFQVTTALRVFLTTCSRFLSPLSGRALLSIPTLRIFVDCSLYPTSFSTEDICDINLDHVAAFASYGGDHYSNFLDFPLKTKSMLVDGRWFHRHRNSRPRNADWDWLNTVQELCLTTTLEVLLLISERFAVCDELYIPIITD